LKIFKKIKIKLYSESFNPGLLGLFINPFYFGRKEMYKNIKLISHEISGKILDIGCGRKPYKELFNYTSYIGLDMKLTGHQHNNSQIDVFYNGQELPFHNNSFDSIIMTEVLEHIFNPEEILAEMNRVLKQEGKLLLTIPFLWIEHEEPYDYARYTPYALEYLLKRNGFSVIYQKKILNDLRCLVQLFTTFLLNKSINNVPWKRSIKNLFLISPFTIIGLLIYRFLPKVENMYLNNLLIIKKINDL